MAYEAVTDGDRVHAVNPAKPDRTLCLLPVAELERSGAAFEPGADDACPSCSFETDVPKPALG